MLDADVLLPAPIRDTLLGAAERGLYRARWSRDILDEIYHGWIQEPSVSKGRP